MADEPQTREALRCCECGRLWLDGLERWRAYLTVDDEVVHYCPECAEREFEGGLDPVQRMRPTHLRSSTMKTIAALVAGFVLGSVSLAFAGAKVDRIAQIWLNTEQTNKRIGTLFTPPFTISGRLDRIQSDMMFQTGKLYKICVAVQASGC